MEIISCLFGVLRLNVFVADQTGAESVPGARGREEEDQGKYVNWTSAQGREDYRGSPESQRSGPWLKSHQASKLRPTLTVNPIFQNPFVHGD